MLGIIKINEGFETTVELDARNESELQIELIAEDAALEQVLESRKVFAAGVAGESHCAEATRSRPTTFTSVSGGLDRFNQYRGRVRSS